ncbi:MAG: hypothetical protein Q7R56_00320 [Nanoarchaeota archaeon]|nr:hypothetical protein [Nanoarchaeota archaeon]
MKPVITVDLDDVALQHISIVLNLLQEEHGFTITLEQITDYYCLEQLTGWSRERIMEVSKQAMHDHRTTPFSGAVENLRSLSTTYDLLFVTSRMADVLRRTHQQAEAYFPFHAGVHFSHQQGNHPAQNYKLTKVRELGSLLHIEDGPHFAEEIANHSIPVILMDRPWNQTLPPHPHIHRTLPYKNGHGYQFAEQWQQIPDMVTDILHHRNP